MEHAAFGQTGLYIPRLVFGTSCLGNLYEALPCETKLAISREWFAHVTAPVVLDTAGKYGAGLALETIGTNLRTLGVQPQNVVISNKLGWLRTPLKGPEPTFEPGVWAGLEHDAEQRISGPGIRACWEQGCELLGDPYRPQLVSVHDPDEYLDGAASANDHRRRLDDIVEAYAALVELRDAGTVAGVGVGAKDWRVIQEIDAAVRLDWIMLANSLTMYRHPPEVLEFVTSLASRGVGIINSAVFHAGFLVGGRFFDYREVSSADSAARPLFEWREKFHALCREHRVDPATACVQFALSPPGVAAVALNTSKPEHVGRNAASVETLVPSEFWHLAKRTGLVSSVYPFL